MKGRRVRALLSQLLELNNPLASQHNVEHHYDLDADLYRRFLDEEMFYSCAYFERDDMTLEAAQQAKCALIARKLDLKPGARVRSEEHTSELQSLMRISYAVFCLKKKKQKPRANTNLNNITDRQ